MGCLSTNNVCGCFSLRSGGIFLGAMGLLWSIVASVYFYRMDQTKYTIAFSVLGFLFVLWLNGIQYKKPAWMFPIVIFWVIILWSSIFVYAYVLYLYVTTPRNKFKIRNIDELMLLGLLFVVIIWDFAAASYSLYKKIKEDRHHQDSIVNQHHRMQPAIIPASYPKIISSYPINTSPLPSAPYFTY